MKTLSADITAQKDAAQSGWCEVYDIYLKSAITGPFGTTDKLRLTNLPGGLSFFTPLISPEAVGTQGSAATYTFWPVKREIVKGDRKTTNDKLQITVSNVSGEWATMLANVDWSDTPIVCRLVSTTVSSPTNDDCVVLFSGLVDSGTITNEQIAFSLSNDLGSLDTIAPRENMHNSCRFLYGDDFCTQIKALFTQNKLVRSGATTTLVKMSSFTTDSGSSASYGTDLVNALADAAITTSSEKTGLTNVNVTANPTSNTLRFDVYPGDGVLTQWQPFTLSATGSMPGGLTAATVYYMRVKYSSTIEVAASVGGAAIDITSAGSGVRLTALSYEGFQVKSSKDSYWAINGNADWGTLSQGYWQIPDAQAGMKNPELKPWIQFDFGAAKEPKLWRIASLSGATKDEDLARLLVFFSSPDGNHWDHETYCELPRIGGTLYDVHHPSARSRRYWRICVRSRWATTFSPNMLEEVRAYEDSRNYFAGGQLKFLSGALTGITRRVLASYNLEALVAPLPVAPAVGDLVEITRGCNGTFNACCERGNWENYGGFLDLPSQTIIR